MRYPYLLAWLSGVSPYQFINAPDKIEPFFHDSQRNDSHCPPPPLLEVFPSDIPPLKPFATEKITLEGGLTLLKGRVSSLDKIQIDNTFSKYEGSFRLSNSAVQLVNSLRREIQDGQLSFRGKRVLELGCGHGFPGIFACLKGASVVHFQDLNAEVLRRLTIPNVTANIDLAQSGKLVTRASHILNPEVRYYAGDWADMDALLSLASQNSDETSEILSIADDGFGRDNKQLKPRKQIMGTQACQRAVESGKVEDGYDIILMSETVCSLVSLSKLYNLIIKCLRPHYGVLYLAGKKQYHRSVGGTRQFKCVADEDGKYKIDSKF